MKKVNVNENQTTAIKNKVRKHLNEDIKESKESIAEDKKLKKAIKKK